MATAGPDFQIILPDLRGLGRSGIFIVQDDRDPGFVGVGASSVSLRKLNIMSTEETLSHDGNVPVCAKLHFRDASWL